jgi:hypothetical protein
VVVDVGFLAMLVLFTVGVIVVAVRYLGVIMAMRVPGGAVLKLSEHAAVVVCDVVVVVGMLDGEMHMLGRRTLALRALSDRSHSIVLRDVVLIA